MNSTIKLPARPRILVIALRRLGDVLLTTPLIRSIRRAWPDATIDVLVFAETAGILDGNPDIDRVVPMENSLMMFQALRARKIASELHVFESGGHGFGLTGPGGVAMPWPALLGSFLKRHGLYA